MSAPRCPSCGSPDFHYIGASMEVWTLRSMPVDGKVSELGELEGSYPLDSFKPYLECDAPECGDRFDLNLNIIPEHIRDPGKRES